MLIVFSPIKYSKTLGFIEKDNYNFVKEYLFKREWFYTIPSGISCILLPNDNGENNKYVLSAYDINEDNQLKYVNDIEVKPINFVFNKYQDKAKYDKTFSLCCNSTGCEELDRRLETPSFDNDDIVGYFCQVSESFNLGRLPNFNGREFYLTKQNYINKLPLFCAKMHTLTNWYEKDVVMVSSDIGYDYLQCKKLLKSSLIYTCLTHLSYMISLKASNSKIYKNELYFDEGDISV